MSLYFVGHSGVVWHEYDSFEFMQQPTAPDDYPVIDIPYPAGITAGDLLIVMSWDAILSDPVESIAPIDTTKWHPMDGLAGYRFPPTYKGHYAYWCIADGTEGGSLTVETAAGLNEWWQPAGVTHGHMQAWRRGSVNQDDVIWPYGYADGSDPQWSFGPFTDVMGDVSIAPYMLGSALIPSGGNECSDVTMADFGVYTPEFEVTSQYTLTRTLKQWPYSTEQWFYTYTFGAAYYPITGGTIPLQTFVFNPSDNSFTGSSGFGFDGLNLGSAEMVGYWGILVTPV